MAKSTKKLPILRIRTSKEKRTVVDHYFHIRGVKVEAKYLMNLLNEVRGTDGAFTYLTIGDNNDLIKVLNDLEVVRAGQRHTHEGPNLMEFYHLIGNKYCEMTK